MHNSNAPKMDVRKTERTKQREKNEERKKEINKMEK